jgi:hypothetical protein
VRCHTLRAEGIHFAALGGTGGREFFVALGAGGAGGREFFAALGAGGAGGRKFFALWRGFTCSRIGNGKGTTSVTSSNGPYNYKR